MEFINRLKGRIVLRLEIKFSEIVELRSNNLILRIERSDEI
jgi:hypothetical protein